MYDGPNSPIPSRHRASNSAIEKYKILQAGNPQASLRRSIPFEIINTARRNEPEFQVLRPVVSARYQKNGFARLSAGLKRRYANAATCTGDDGSGLLVCFEDWRRATLLGSWSPKSPGCALLPVLGCQIRRGGTLQPLSWELTTISSALQCASCTPGSLKQKHPGFEIWNLLEDREVLELINGRRFKLKTCAESVGLRKFGLASRETLKRIARSS